MDIPNNWSFDDKSIANGIDHHITEQLPWYPLALDMTVHLARCYLGENSTLVDLGCSTGGVTRALKPAIIARNVECYSYDCAQEMVDRFTGIGKIECMDMRETSSIPSFNVAILMLSLMFTDIKGRESYLRELEDKCRPGGAIIILDKVVLPEWGYLGQNITDMTTVFKKNSGVSAEDIIKKHLSLRGVQRPTPERVFLNKGFSKWFQFGEFAGYIKEVT